MSEEDAAIQKKIYGSVVKNINRFKSRNGRYNENS